MAYTDLNYLSTITEGNKQIMREMIEMFVVQVPEFIENLQNCYQTRQFDALGREAHKAKSSLQIMGMSDLVREMKIFQLKTMDGRDVESYPVHIRNFEIQCQGAVKELQDELNNL
jgi:HPt (histidine-containing phosphotransfer) domain-containing protein